MSASMLSPLKKSALVLATAAVATAGVLSAPAHAKKNHVHVYVGVPLGIGYVGTGYGYEDCGWLKKKAYNTGSAYWWKKYKKCKWG